MIENEDILRETLRLKRRDLHIVKLQIAKTGSAWAPPALIGQEFDLEREVRQLERDLGIAQPEPPRRAYEAPKPARAFAQEVEDQQTRMRQEEIAHQLSLLNIHRRNIGHLSRQMRELGAYTPPYVRSELEDARANIASIKRTLRAAGVAVDDLESDQ